MAHSQASHPPIRKNPFRAQALRPGFVPFYFAGPGSVEQLLVTFTRLQFRGQIVGPHGSGKSTLLSQLILCLRQQGHHVQTWVGTVESLPPVDAKALAESRGILAMDGFEQLSCLKRLQIWRDAVRRRTGLLVTTHRRQPFLPVLWRTSRDVQTLAHVARQLWVQEYGTLAEFPAEWTDPFMTDLLAEHGSVREALFALYDRCGEQQPKCTDAGTNSAA